MFLVAWLVAVGWLLSFVGWFNRVAVAGIVGAVLTALWIRRQAGSWQKLWTDLREPFAAIPILIIVLLIGAAGLGHFPTMLDALTYRIPRVLIWLEQGGVRYIQSGEERLNYLCQGWGFCSAPIIQLFGLRYSFGWSFISWLVCYMVFFRWAMRLEQSVARARWLATIASASIFGVLQACSAANDLMATTLLILALHHVFQFQWHEDKRDISWAFLCFCLSTSIKPHLAVMGLPLAIWFFAAHAKPWRVFQWRWLPLTLPVLVLCSATPSFVLNYQHYGGIMGPKPTADQKGAGPLQNMALGSAMLGWQMLQPGINPAAFYLQPRLDQWVNDSGIRKVVPKFNLRTVPLNMTDNASFGMVTTILLGLGILTAWRHRQNQDRAAVWSWWGGLAGGVGFLMAVSQVLPETVGRSFLAFAFFIIPLAIVGWSRWPERWLKIAGWLAVAVVAAVLVLNPARPLWPVQWMRAQLLKAHQSGWASRLEMYLRIQERRTAGRELADKIPDDEVPFNVAIATDRPLLPVLSSRHGAGDVRLLPTGSGEEALSAISGRYLLFCDPLGESYPKIAVALQNTNRWELVEEQYITCKLIRGPERWALYRLRDSSARVE